MRARRRGTHGVAVLCAKVLAAVLAATLGPASTAHADELVVSLSQPGGGYLVTDSKQRIPLELRLSDVRGPLELTKAVVVPGAGRAHDVTIVGPGRVLFNYQPPDKLRTGRDVGEVRVERKDGSSGSFTFSVELGAPAAPKLSLELLPARYLAESAQTVSIAATALAASDLVVVPSHGELSSDPAQRRGDDLELVASFAPPKDLPVDAPSHISFLAAASGPRGWAARLSGLSVLSPLRVSLTIDPGYELVLEGTENKPEPVPAPRRRQDRARGRGALRRARAGLRGEGQAEEGAVGDGALGPGARGHGGGHSWARRGRRRHRGPRWWSRSRPEPSAASPCGRSSPWRARAWCRWPPVPGAKDTKVLVLERPRRAETVTVLADGTALATLTFRAAHGEVLALSPAAPRSNERGAAVVRVTDVLGSPADQPVPRARLDGGDELPVQRMGRGEYRVIVPATLGGEAGKKRTLTVDLAPPKRLDDTPVELVTAQLPLTLVGAAVVAKAQDEPIATPQPDRPEPDDPTREGWRIGALGSAAAGSTFGGALMLGVGAQLELRLPVLSQRLSVRTGLEYFRASGAGTVLLGGVATNATSLAAGLVIPVDLGFVVVRQPGFELLVRAGAELRNEVGVLDVGTDRVGGGSRFGVSARAGVEADFDVGPGSLCAIAGVAGLAASSDGFSSPTLTFEGALTHFRLDVGYRLWF
jgi:hypothetical protein